MENPIREYSKSVKYYAQTRPGLLDDLDEVIRVVKIHAELGNESVLSVNRAGGGFQITVRNPSCVSFAALDDELGRLKMKYGYVIGVKIIYHKRRIG